MKRIVLFAVLMMAVALPYAAGQGAASSTGHFEWAKGYNSNMDGYIKGTVTDSLGNLYILGQVHWASIWDDTLSVAPPLSTQTTMVLVAKISPEGEIVWKKMFGDSTNDTYADDIKPLGDTGFAVMFWTGLISLGYDMRYWGDSMCNNVLHPQVNPYDTPGRRFDDGAINTYMSFDFDGNITEEHALEISYVDFDGNEYGRSYSQNPDSLLWLKMSFLAGATFDVDSVGNIYICYFPGDYPSPHRYYNTDRLAAIRFWTDHRLVGESIIYDNSDSARNRPQLVKFSPHFDTVLASRYVVQKTDLLNLMQTSIKWNNASARLYARIMGTNDGSGSDRFSIIVDSVLNFAGLLDTNNLSKSFLVVYDGELNADALIELRDTAWGSNSNATFGAGFVDVAFDNDSNLLFVSTGVGKWGVNSGFIYRNTILPLDQNACVLAFDMTNYDLHSVMQFPARKKSQISSAGRGTLKAKNNRVFIQAQYHECLVLPSGYFFTHSNTDMGLGLAIFDYQGNLIEGYDYGCVSNNNTEGPIALVDSTLYLVNHLAANAKFGNIQYYVMSYAACVAKYVDPAFMDVYQPVGIAEVDVTNHTIYPNPVENLLHVRLENDNILQATAISVLGTKEQLDAVGNTVDVSRLQSGIYIMELTTVHGTYNFKFIKQ